MTFGPKRAHFLSIFDNFVKDFGLLAITIVIGLIAGDFSIVMDNLPILVIVLIGPVFRLFGFLFTKYSIDETKLVQEKSFISKSNLEIPLSTVTTVDVSQSFLQQIFGIYTLHIDNASNISDTSSKINMTLGREDMITVKELLVLGREGMDGLNPFAESEKKDNDGVVNKAIKISPVQIIIYGLLEAKVVALIELIGVFGFFSAFINMSDEKIDSAFGRFFDLFDSLGAFVVFSIVIIVLFIVVTIIAVIKSFVKYYDFTLLDNGKALKINYGIFKKKSYTIQKNRITGFSFEQSFLMRLFNVGILKVFAIGYGGSDDQESYEEPLIYPLIRKDKLYSSMQEIVPEISGSYDYKKPEPRSIRYFFYNLGLIISICALIGLIIASAKIDNFRFMWIFGAALVILSVISICLRYQCTGISGDEKTVSLCYGGFGKTAVFIKTSSIESVKFKTSYFKKKKGIGHIEVGHIAPLITATHSVDNLNVENFEEIKKLIIY